MEINNMQELVSFVTKASLPDWQKKLFSKYSEAVQVHSKGELFCKIDTLYPNEHPASKEQRIMSFEPITKGSFLKGISNIMRIFTNSYYTASTSKNTAQYITQNVFDNKDLFSYFLEQWISRALGDDPNGRFVVYPPEFMQGKTFDQLLFIPSQHIIYIDNDTVIFKSEEESEIKVTVETKKTFNQFFPDTVAGVNTLNYTEAKENTYTYKLKTEFVRTVFHVFNKNKFYRLEQKKGDTETYLTDEYLLGANVLPPVISAGGMKAEKDIYESFLCSFVPFGNLALIQHSQHTAVNFMFSFPRMSELQGACDYDGCTGGKVVCAQSDLFPDGLCNCPQCKGSGYVSNQTPYKMYIKKYTTDDLQTNEHLDIDDVKYYTPPVGILDYSKKEWKDYLEMAEKAIYIMQKIETGNVESAKSKEQDLDQLYSFLLRVSAIFYDRLRFIIQAFENYQNANPVQVTVNIPYSFAILSEYEAFEILNVILTSNAPALVKGNHVENFITKFVSANSGVKKAYEVLKRVDLLLLKTDNEIATLKSNSIVTNEQWSIHTFSYPVLMQLYEQDKTLFNLEVSAIAEKLKTELQQYKPMESDLKTQLKNAVV